MRYIGVEGIGGMGTTDTLVEDNLIEWVGWQGAERAWEAAGAKFHRARNLLFRRNVVRHIRHANAVWLDVGNSNSRITANVFADVLTVSAAVHMEMSLAINQVDNNIIWDIRNAEPGTPGQRGAAGSGVFLHASEKQIVAQNFIGRCDNVGVFPVLRPDREGSGNGRDTGSATTCSSDARTAASSSCTRTTRLMAMSTPPCLRSSVASWTAIPSSGWTCPRGARADGTPRAASPISTRASMQIASNSV